MTGKRQAKLVLAVAIPLIALLAGPIACTLSMEMVQPTAMPSKAMATIPLSTPTFPLPTPLPPSTPTLPEPQMPTSPSFREVVIYMVALDDQGKSGIAVGCGDSLVAIKRPVAPTSQPVETALRELFSIKDQNVGQSGLYNALWQSNLQVASAQVDAAGVATVSLAGFHQLGGECDTPRFKGQIEQTILAVPGVKSAVIFLDGRPIDDVLSLR